MPIFKKKMYDRGLCKFLWQVWGHKFQEFSDTNFYETLHFVIDLQGEVFFVCLYESYKKFLIVRNNDKKVHCSYQYES